MSYVQRSYRDSQSYVTLTADSKGGDTQGNASTTYPSDPVIIEPLQIKVTHNQVEKAMRIFRSIVQRDGILAEYKEHQRYEKPSETRRRKAMDGKRKVFEERMAQVRAPKEKKIRRRPIQEENSELV